MAAFRTGVKISSLSFSKAPHYIGSSEQISGNNVIARDLSFWRRSKESRPEKRAPACDRGWRPEEPKLHSCSSSACNERKKPPKPKRPWLNFCKIPKPINEKPGNCPTDEASNLQQESFWNYLFNFDTKPIPDPCTCRLAYLQKQANKKEDHRLQDPRYKPTKGGALLYTELPRRECCTSGEPRPKPPPSYKLPNAVRCKQMVEAAEMASCKREFGPKGGDKKDQFQSFWPRKMPYEEFRPIRKSRSAFSCEKGISERDVAQPDRKENHYRFGEWPLSELGLAVDQPIAKASVGKPDAKFEDGRIDARANLTKLSRFEQLQKLTTSRRERTCPPRRSPSPESKDDCKY